MLIFIRCLEEGAEDFIVKPVKLSDVKRLKNCMFGEGRVLQRQDKGGVNKRKLQDSSDVSLSPPLDYVSNSSSPTSSPCSPRSFSSLPSSPTSLDSPTRRFRRSFNGDSYVSNE